MSTHNNSVDLNLPRSFLTVAGSVFTILATCYIATLVYIWHDVTTTQDKNSQDIKSLAVSNMSLSFEVKSLVESLDDVTNNKITSNTTALKERGEWMKIVEARVSKMEWQVQQHEDALHSAHPYKKHE